MLQRRLRTDEAEYEAKGVILRVAEKARANCPAAGGLRLQQEQTNQPQEPPPRKPGSSCRLSIYCTDQLGDWVRVAEPEVAVAVMG